MISSFSPDRSRTTSDIYMLSSAGCRCTGSWSTLRSASLQHPRSPSSVIGWCLRDPDHWRKEWPIFKTAPPPKTASQLRRFLGILNFYRRFLPQAATTTRRPLRPQSQRLSSHCLDAWTPQGLRRVQGKLVTCHATSAPRANRATCTSHRRLHFRHGCRATATWGVTSELVIFIPMVLAPFLRVMRLIVF
jgi:hypothetical protein